MYSGANRVSLHAIRRVSGEGCGGMVGGGSRGYDMMSCSLYVLGPSAPHTQRAKLLVTGSMALMWPVAAATSRSAWSRFLSIPSCEIA